MASSSDDNANDDRQGGRDVIERLDRKEILQRIGTIGAYLSSTFAALFLGGFGSFLPARILWVCWGIAAVTPMVDLGVRPSWRLIWKHLQQRAGHIHIPDLEQPVGAGESAGALLKVSLALMLLGLLAHWKSATELSSACTNSCPSRAQENLQAIVIAVLVLEGLPALIVRLDAGRYTTWLLIFKRFWQERNCNTLKTLTNTERMILQSYPSSALSFIIVLTASLLLGGNFGTFMTKLCFWTCWAILITESLAGGIYHLQTRASTWRTRSGWQHHAINLFRGLLQGSLSIGLLIIVANETFYPSDLPDSVCDHTCRRNTKGLLIITCACSIIQAVSLQLAPLQSFSILFAVPLLLYFVVAVIVLVMVAGVIVLLAVIFAVGYTLFVLGCVYILPGYWMAVFVRDAVRGGDREMSLALVAFALVTLPVFYGILILSAFFGWQNISLIYRELHTK